MRSRLMLLLCLALATLLSTACGPEYPKCDDNEDCAESDKGQSDGKLICVNGLCQQCKIDSDCGDASLECNAGICEAIPNFCTSVDDCPGNQKCRDNRCGAECLEDTECPDGRSCEGGSCVAPAECTVDGDCADGKVCEGGSCVTPTAGNCSVETVYFAYDSSVIDDAAQRALRDNAQCIQDRNMSVRLEGHADERGTSEYNIALGERRARNVYQYLKNLGVKGGSMDTLSYGEEQLVRECGEDGPESCHRRNRRVEFIPK